MGEHVEGQKPLEIHLWEDKKGNNNFHLQFEERTLKDLSQARDQGKKIIHHGIAVSFSLSLSL